jgi:hypothetical protein
VRLHNTEITGSQSNVMRVNGRELCFDCTIAYCEQITKIKEAIGRSKGGDDDCMDQKEARHI